MAGHLAAAPAGAEKIEVDDDGTREPDAVEAFARRNGAGERDPGHGKVGALIDAPRVEIAEHRVDAIILWFE